MSPKSIELFSGSGTVSQVLLARGFDTFTVDINPRLNPQLCCDILTLQPEQLPSPCLFFWASPDCSTFSRAAFAGQWKKITLKYRQYLYKPTSEKSVLGLLLLLKTIDLIKALNPPVWFIENPVGRMRHIKELQQLAPFRYSVNYMDWGFYYSKETDLFTNQYLPLPQKKVIRSGPGLRSVNSRYQRSIVPSELVRFLIDNSSGLKKINS